MARQEDFLAALARIDAATTDIANDLRDLKAQIEGQGLSAEIEDSILAQLEAKAVQLESIAAETPGEPTEPEEPEA